MSCSILNNLQNNPRRPRPRPPTPAPVPISHSHRVPENSTENKEDKNKSENAGEPINRNFEETLGNLPQSYLEDWIVLLQRQNRERIENSRTWRYVFLTRSALDYIFTVCTRLQLPHDVRFTAALIFDSYMCTHTRDAHFFVNNLVMEDEKKKSQWAKTECNITRQIPLRILSAIQIASKDCSYHESLDTSTVAKVLRHLGSPYTARAIIKSEVRVLKTINYKIPDTPLLFAESVLSCLTADVASTEQLMVNSIWQHVLLFMDVIFLYYTEIITLLVKESMPNKDSVISKTHIARCKEDWILISGGVVSAAIACIHGLKKADELSRNLARIVRVPAQDIIDLTVILLEIVEKENRAMDAKNRTQEIRDKRTRKL